MRKSTVAKERGMWCPVKHSCEHIEYHRLLKRFVSDESQKLGKQVCTACQERIAMNINAMSINEIIHGDALLRLKMLPNNAIQCVVTSPPYYGLRSYLADGHPDKALEVGAEETPGEYIEKLVQVFREVRRVLRNDGTCWLNLGDSYADGKQLMMIPARVAIALQEDGWILRNDIIWHKPNAVPESVLDRATNDHEHIFLLTKSEHYYYDIDAIREPVSASFLERWGTATPARKNPTRERAKSVAGGGESCMGAHPLGRNKRSVWTVNTSKFLGAHFAVMAPKVAETCILAGSRPGDIVMDCFAGAATTLIVAAQHKRKWLGIELNPGAILIANERLATLQPVLWDVDRIPDELIENVEYWSHVEHVNTPTASEY